jgi:hypothetical protein
MDFCYSLVMSTSADVVRGLLWHRRCGSCWPPELKSTMGALWMGRRHCTKRRNREEWMWCRYYWTQARALNVGAQAFDHSIGAIAVVWLTTVVPADRDVFESLQR